MKSKSNRLQTRFASIAEMPVTPSGSESDDDYMLVASEPASTTIAANGGVTVAGASALSSASMNHDTLCEFEPLQHLEGSGKDLVMLHCYPSISSEFGVSMQLCRRRHVWERLFSFAGI